MADYYFFLTAGDGGGASGEKKITSVLQPSVGINMKIATGML